MLASISMTFAIMPIALVGYIVSIVLVAISTVYRSASARRAASVLFVLTWPQHLKHAGLACATVLSEAVYAVILALLLRRRWGKLNRVTLLKSFGRTTFNAGLMLAAAIPLLGFVTRLSAPLDLHAKAEQIVTVLITILIAALFYFLLSWLTRSPELAEILNALRRRKREPGEPVYDD